MHPKYSGLSESEIVEGKNSAGSEVASQVSTQHRSALVLLIKSIMDQIDEVSLLRRQGATAALSIQLLRETCSVLSELPPELATTYVDTLLALSDSFGVTAPRSVSEDYTVAIAPKKRQFTAKMRDTLLVA